MLIIVQRDVRVRSSEKTSNLHKMGKFGSKWEAKWAIFGKQIGSLYLVIFNSLHRLLESVQLRAAAAIV